MTAPETTTPALHHVNLKTRRLDEMIAWYGTTVGMRVQHRFSGGAWLANDGANHRLALLSPPNLSDDPDKIQHTGLHHTAYEFPTIPALLATYERLKGAGILPHACLDHGMTMSMYSRRSRRQQPRAPGRCLWRLEPVERIHAHDRLRTRPDWHAFRSRSRVGRLESRRGAIGPASACLPGRLQARTFARSPTTPRELTGSLKAFRAVDRQTSTGLTSAHTTVGDHESIRWRTR